MQKEASEEGYLCGSLRRRRREEGGKFSSSSQFPLWSKSTLQGWATSSTGLVSSWLVASPEERDSNSNEIRMKSK